MTGPRRPSPKLIERAARVVLDGARQIGNGVHSANKTTAGSLDTMRRVSLTCAADVKVCHVPWLWRPYLPAGRLVILDGPPDVAKSLLTCDVAARVSTGEPFPFSEERREPGVVVMVNFEDNPADTIVPRLIAAGADLDRVLLWSAVHIGDDAHGDPMFTIGTDTEALTEKLLEVKATLLIVDPLAAALDHRVDTSRDSHVRRELAKLHQLAEATGATAKAVRHIVKSAGGGSAINAGGGSVGIIGAARGGLLAVRDRDDKSKRYLAITKGNLVGDEERATLTYTVVGVPVAGTGIQPRIEWLGTSSATADELVAQLGERPEEASDRRSIDEWLREYLRSERKPATDVYRDGDQAGGWSPKQLWRSLRRVGGRSEREGYGKDGKFFWALGDSNPPIGSIDSAGMNGINESCVGTVDVPA